MVRRILQIILLLPSILLVLGIDCEPRYFYCDDDSEFVCNHLYTTAPREHPVYFDELTPAVLFANGELMTFPRRLTDTDYQIYDLREICTADTICEIRYYNWYMKYDNYSTYQAGLENDTCIFIISPIKIIKLDYQYNVLQQFGQMDDSSGGLHNAISGAVDIVGNFYVFDDNDNSIKKYSYDGSFLASGHVDGAPIKIDLFDDTLYVLDAGNNMIWEYDTDCNYLGPAINEGVIAAPVAFDIFDTDRFWVAHYDGCSIALIKSETNSENAGYNGYCYYDMKYELGKVVYISGNFSWFHLVDWENNYLISGE
jgi:hypothetical protein